MYKHEINKRKVWIKPYKKVGFCTGFEEGFAVEMKIQLAEEIEGILARIRISDTHEICSLRHGEYDATNGSTRNDTETKIYTYKSEHRANFQNKLSTSKSICRLSGKN